MDLVVIHEARMEEGISLQIGVSVHISASNVNRQRISNKCKNASDLLPFNVMPQAPTPSQIELNTITARASSKSRPLSLQTNFTRPHPLQPISPNTKPSTQHARHTPQLHVKRLQRLPPTHPLATVPAQRECILQTTANLHVDVDIWAGERGRVGARHHQQ